MTLSDVSIHGIDAGARISQEGEHGKEGRERHGHFNLPVSGEQQITEVQSPGFILLLQRRESNGSNKMRA